MKRTIAIAVAMLLCLFVGMADAAGTLVVTGDYILKSTETGGVTRVVTITCTSHTDNSFSDTIVAMETGLQSQLAGWVIDEIWTAPGSTAPTDATDFVINATVGSVTLDILGGAGTDMLDATSHLKFTTLSGGTAKQVVIPKGTLTVTTSNNAVASAIFYLVLWLR